MSRTSVRLDISDLSQFTKNLSKQWPEEKPTHLSLMNLLAKSAGYKNFQHLKASDSGPEAQQLSASEKRWGRLVSHMGTITRWPTKRKDQLAILWRTYHSLPEFEQWTQQQLDGWIKNRIEFGDHVLMRREFIELGMVARTNDGRKYWKLKQEIPEEFIPFISRFSQAKG